MRIQTTMIRKGGSHVELGGTIYHFAEQADGRHICDVRDTKHIKILLKIDGYEVADDADREDPRSAGITAPAAPEPAPAAPAPVADDTDADAAADTDEDAVTATLIDDEPAATTDAAAPPVSTEYDAMDDAAIKEAFATKLGRAPHPQMKRDSMIAKLIETNSTGA